MVATRVLEGSFSAQTLSKQLNSLAKIELYIIYTQ